MRPFLVILALLCTFPTLFVAAVLAFRGQQVPAAVVAFTAVLSLGMMTVSRVERTKIERSLAARHRQTDAILDASADAYVAMDARSFIIAWSGKAEELFGWTAAEAIGRTVTETIIPPDVRAGHDEGVQRYNETGHGPVLGTRVELEALHRDGHTFPIELAVWEAQAEEETVFVSFIHDISDRRHKEAELAEARDAAMEASRLKSEFVANMSHEIRTPMNGVIGMADLLTHTRLTPLQREYTETIRLSADALLAVINDILDFSKIEAGKLQLDERDFEPRSVVDDVAALIAATAHSKGVELVVNVDADVPAVMRGDSGRLRQILLNIAGNAVKFTDVGEVLIEAKVEERTAAQAVLRFTVCDSGPGIDPVQHSSLFESFSQGDASSTRRHGGTGLGLAISKRLAELMGGDISFESEVGTGSKFWVTAAFGIRPKQVGPVQDHIEALQGAPVLVVDDNATNRRILELTLSRWGLVPTLAASAAEAKVALEDAYVANRAFFLALLDLQMPGVDGAELARFMAQDPRYSEVHRILLTSTGDNGGLSDGEIARHLTKPVRQSLLFDSIAELAGLDERMIAAAEAVPDDNSVKGANGQILLVEDNPVNQTVGRHMLENLGYRVDVAANGVQAVTKVKDTSYVAVLMDCQMPEMDGYEATRVIRAGEIGKRIPIVALTASAMEGDAERCLEAGMDDYLAKPVRMEQLAVTLARWIKDNDAPPTGPSNGTPDANIQTLNQTTIDGIFEMVAGSDGGGQEMVDVFITTMSGHLKNLSDAINADDHTTVTRVAHSIKGSAAVFGAENLSALAARFPHLLSAVPPDRRVLEKQVSEMIEEFDRVRVLLREQLQSH